MRTAFSLASLMVMCIVYVNGNVFMHNPRGSNNRLDERYANRINDNRVFDSQNNGRGGYNIGDLTDKSAGYDPKKHYQMTYFMSGATKNDITKLLIEWTNQHGCGENEDESPNNLNCNIVLQYMLEVPNSNAKYQFRDGADPNTPIYSPMQGYNYGRLSESQSSYNNRKSRNVYQRRVYQEPHEWYDKCLARRRNKGLFTADQNLNDHFGATATRQNPTGQRKGYECPEERDYYPYWHPTPWRDIAILTKNVEKCNFYKTESFNVKPKGECVTKWPNSNNDRHYSRSETPEKCKEEGGEWIDFYNYLEFIPDKTNETACKSAGYTWGIPYLISGDNRRTPRCLKVPEAPECLPAPFSRHNHLGNGDDLEALRYEWKLPKFDRTKDIKFLVRIRYNISSDDYDPFNTDYKFNGEDKSPITNYPLIDVGASDPMRLAINTAQFGRTFQDRSHISIFKSRPSSMASGIIHNLNVRGKRGDIVQTFPAVMYDFIPNKLTMKQDDMVHFQWTGSNSHNNGNRAGDGEAGDAGQGKAGTDRSNIVGLAVLDDNFPMLMENKDNMCHHMELVWQPQGKSNMTWYDYCLKLGSGGYYDCKEGCSNALDTKAKMNSLLDNAPATFQGMVVKFKTKKTFHYTCTRNNNFANRSQKGSITVE